MQDVLERLLLVSFVFSLVSDFFPLYVPSYVSLGTESYL